MKQLTRRIIIPVIILSFVIIVIPICINEAYKCNAGYTTLWGASELLAYYGTILGAISSIAIAVMTIRFTRKQIKSGNFLDQETRKWTQIENDITSLIKDINPVYISEIASKTHFNESAINIHQAIMNLYQYTYALAIIYDNIFALVSAKDIKKIEKLVMMINSVTKKYNELALEAIRLLQKCYERKAKYEAGIVIYKTEHYGGNIEDNREFNLEFFAKEMQSIIDKVLLENQLSYKKLLELKVETFDTIYNMSQKDAERFLD